MAETELLLDARVTIIVQIAFHNITRVMDCVGCEKCKMHGKLNILGIASAMKVCEACIHNEGIRGMLACTLEIFCGDECSWVGNNALLLLFPQSSAASVTCKASYFAWLCLSKQT